MKVVEASSDTVKSDIASLACSTGTTKRSSSPYTDDGLGPLQHSDHSFSRSTRTMPLPRTS